MSIEEKEVIEDSEKKAAKKLSRKLDAVGWGMFFIWIGVVLITGVETGVVLLGIGIIILGEQATRRYFDLRMEKFWTIVGLLFLGGGLWDLSNLNAPFGAVVLIVIGVLILISAMRKGSSRRLGEEDTSAAPSPDE